MSDLNSNYKKINIVWFKRDLRTFDNAALFYALKNGPSVALFILEPEWIESPEFSYDHLNFVLHCIQELQTQLQSQGIPFIIKQGSAINVFNDLNREYSIKEIFSHEETGLEWSYHRDLQVQKWCRNNSIPWNEYPQFGVIRRLKNRDSWAEKRERIINRELFPLTGQTLFTSPWSSHDIPWDLLDHKPLKTQAQIGGHRQAMKTLDSFFQEKGEVYFKSLSSPVIAFEGCSRISPYLSWGQISMTQVHQMIQRKRRSIVNLPFEQRTNWSKSLKSFEDRLWWHCHFIQKLESEPEIENQNFNREFDGMREADWNEEKFQAWCQAETGYPMIDACMMALKTHGWINFRMRAMLMSFASYQLWLHWKRPAIFLAQQFLDFEPGIHYSQAQMQSGVTGINAIRIYSPKKQLLDHDPSGKFIRQYLPQLNSMSNADLAEPHKMPPLLQLTSGFRLGVDYPLPIVDPDISYREAKEKIFNWKKRPETQKKSQEVLVKHGSRGSNHFPKQKRFN